MIQLVLGFFNQLIKINHKYIANRSPNQSFANFIKDLDIKY